MEPVRLSELLDSLLANLESLKDAVDTLEQGDKAEAESWNEILGNK